MTMLFTGGIILKELIMYVKEVGRLSQKKMITYAGTIRRRPSG